MSKRQEPTSDVGRLKSMLRYAFLRGALRWGGLMLGSVLLIQRFYFRRVVEAEDMLFLAPLFLGLGFFVGFMT